MTIEKHGTRVLKVKTGIKGGRIAVNHSARTLKVKTGIKGGRISLNHNARLSS